MRKYTFYSEVAFALGLLLLALGTAITARMELGISMVVAPAYLLHLYVPGLSFGAAEYVLQAVVLTLLMLVLRKVRLGYLLSFATTVVYGFLLDGAVVLVSFLPGDGWVTRIGLYGVGVVLCTLAIALLLRSYLPPAAYELFVKEVAGRFGWRVSRVKLVYDWVSCALALGLSLLLFGRIEAVGIGTLVCAAVYGPLIGLFDKALETYFTFTDIRRKVYE